MNIKNTLSSVALLKICISLTVVQAGNITENEQAEFHQACSWEETDALNSAVVALNPFSPKVPGGYPFLKSTLSAADLKVYKVLFTE